MFSDGTFSYWMTILAGMMIGVFLAEPKLRKPILGVFLLSGIAWLTCGVLFGFETTEAAAIEAAKFMLGAFLIMLIIAFAIVVLIVVCENPSVAIMVLLLWFGLSDRDKDD